MDAFVKQIPVSETIFGNIKKPPDIICVVVSVFSVDCTDDEWRHVFFDFIVWKASLGHNVGGYRSFLVFTVLLV